MCFELTAVWAGESAQSHQPVIRCVSNEWAALSLKEVTKGIYRSSQVYCSLWPNEQIHLHTQPHHWTAKKAYTQRIHLDACLSSQACRSSMPPDSMFFFRSPKRLWMTLSRGDCCQDSLVCTCWRTEWVNLCTLTSEKYLIPKIYLIRFLKAGVFNDAWCDSPGRNESRGVGPSLGKVSIIARCNSEACR